MRLLMIGITAAFMVFALLQLNDPDPGVWFSIYAAGALGASLSLIRDLSRNTQRLLAVSTMLLMFFYFFGFFQLAPGLTDAWWHFAGGREALGLLFAAFAMIPVLSSYSCRLKATGASKDGRGPAVFSAPNG